MHLWIIFSIIAILFSFFIIVGIKFLTREKVKIETVNKRCESNGKECYVYFGRIVKSKINKTVSFKTDEKKYNKDDIVYV